MYVPHVVVWSHHVLCIALQAISDIVRSGSSKRNDETAKDQCFSGWYVIGVSNLSQPSTSPSTL